MQKVAITGVLKGLRHLTVLLAMSLFGGVLAQDLAASTPAGSLLAFGFWQDGEPAADLRADLAALDWEQGLDTLVQFAQATGADEEFEMFAALLGADDALADADEGFCPDLRRVLTPDSDHVKEANMLASVGFSPFNPMPAFTLLAELGPEHADLYSDAVAALQDCASSFDEVELLSLDQDGVPFWQLTYDFDASVAFAHSDGVFALSSSPDQLRYVLRLLAGSDEPSLADSRLYADWAALERGASGFDWYVDYSVLADLVQNLGPSFGSEELATELAGSLRTAGGTAGSLSLQAEGLVYENLLLPDPAGTDTELLDLLLSRGIGLPDAPIITGDAVAVTSQVVNVQGFIAYLQSWLDRLAPMVGEDLDLRSLLAEAGVDIDTALLNWIGNDMHVVQLETSTAGLSSMMSGPAQLFAVSTTDASAAMAGVQELLDLTLLISEFDSELVLGVDKREEQYRGVDYTRIRLGPVSDIGVATLGGYLLVGMPTNSLLLGIDTFLDGSGSADVPSGPAGADIVQAAWLDVGAELDSLAGVLERLVQPVAWITRLAGVEMTRESEWDDWDPTVQDWSDGFSYGFEDLSGVETIELALGTSLELDMTYDTTTDSSPIYYFTLSGLEAGTSFSVSMSSDTFDTTMSLFNLETGDEVAYNDDYDWYQGTDSRIDYTAQAGVTYVVKAEAWDFYPEGTFTISLFADTGEEVEEVEEETVEVPSFGQLLDLYDLIPQAVSVLADRTGRLEGYQERRGDTIYTRYTLQADW